MSDISSLETSVSPDVLDVTNMYPAEPQSEIWDLQTDQWNPEETFSSDFKGTLICVWTGLFCVWWVVGWITWQVGGPHAAPPPASELQHIPTVILRPEPQQHQASTENICSFWRHKEQQPQQWSPAMIRLPWQRCRIPAGLWEITRYLTSAQDSLKRPEQ